MKLLSKSLIFILFLILIGCTKLETKTDINNLENTESKEDFYEITKVDILKLPEIKSTKIQVMGVKVGDDIIKALEVFGPPDIRPNDQFGKNYEWSKKFNSPHTLIQIGVDDEDKIKIIHIYPGFETYLVGDTKKLLQNDITDGRTLHALLGLEDDKEVKNFELISTSLITYKYFKEGIEVIELDGKPNGFILVYPIKER